MKLPLFPFILLLLWTATSPAQVVPALVNVRDYGATGRKADDATPAIAHAIQAARSAGGSVVQVPPGDYTANQIVLYDNITLQLDAGAVSYVDLESPTVADGRGFIYAERAKHVTIRGRGKIDGQARYIWADYTTHDAEIEAEVELARRAGVAMKRSYRVGKSAYTLLFKACEDVVIDDITIENSSLWAARIWGSHKVRIRYVTIRSDLTMGVNPDGIDLDGTSNAHVSGCPISTGDDAICLKTGRWNATEPATYPTENIVVTNCILTSSSAALKIGSETFAPVRHVLFNSCIIRNANRGISINVQDGATVSDIVFANLTMDLHRRHWNWWGSGKVFSLVLKKRRPESVVGTSRNITFDNVTAYAQGTSRAVTLVDKPLENLRLSNLRIYMEPETTPDKRTANARLFSDVHDLTLNDVAVCWNDQTPEPAWQSGLLNQVRNFRLRNVSARPAHRSATQPAILLTNCADGILSELTAQRGTATFMAVRGEATRNLLLHTHYLTNARLPSDIDKAVRKGAVTVKPLGQ